MVEDIVVFCKNCNESYVLSATRVHKTIYDRNGARHIETWFLCPNCHQLDLDKEVKQIKW